MKTKFHRLFIALVLLALATFNYELSTGFAQGSLTPPGAPAPTMKTLDQVEARTPIDAAHTPGGGTNQFIISAPGSYYLTGNITGVSGFNGISINADNVTVDLNGFALIGVPGSGTGIIAPTPHWNLRVHNGSVQNWGGVIAIDASQASNSQFDHLRLSRNQAGLKCGNGSLLSDCCAETNATIGILTGDQSTLTGCNAKNNGSLGFYTGYYCTMTASAAIANTAGGLLTQDGGTIVGCTASANSGTGFAVGNGCTVKDCTANNNAGAGISGSSLCTIKDCTASGNTGTNGIMVLDRSTITGCTAGDNLSGNGISYGSDCLISGNNASRNINGFQSNGSLNRIDGNTANHNTHIGILWGNDIMMRNSAFANTTLNYSPAAGTGNSGPLNVSSTSTSPWANF